MFKLMDKKIITILCKLFLLNWPYDLLYFFSRLDAKVGEMVCCVCLGEDSDKPNEIVLCDNCGQGKTLALLTHFSHRYQLDQSTSILRDVWWYFSFLLTHLSRSDKVSFRDQSSSSVGVC